MERFKFGDKVRFHDGVEAVVQGCYEDTLLVAYEECGHDFFKLSDLEGKIQKVPHPDTVRLEWLESHEYELRYDDPKWWLVDDVYGEVFVQGETIREAIDVAMQHEAES